MLNRAAKLAIIATAVFSLLAAQPAFSATAIKVAQPTAAEITTLAQQSVRSALATDNIYFVMTDRYANGDTSNDRGGLIGGRSIDGFDPTDQAYYHGGDLKGLTGNCTTGEGVARIKSMGFSTIWITPPFVQRYVQGDSAAYHGYWITDFLNIDPHIGTNADFKTFVDCAHSQGMKVVLDIVVNHTGDVITGTGSGAKIPPADKKTKNPAWLNKLTNYHNMGDVQDWGDKFQYQNGDFFGLDDIKTENKEVVDGFAAAYATWVNDYGVDAFRIDTAKHVDDAFFGKWWPKISALTKAKKPNLFAFGEVFDSNPETLATFTRQRGLPSVLDFDFQSNAVTYAGGDGDAGYLLYVFNHDDLFTTANRNAYNLVTFLGNHDMGRAAYMLQKNGATKATLLQASLFANEILYLSRGIPSVYYGDEIGMIGLGGDQLAREDMGPSQTDIYKAEARVTGAAIGNGSSLGITDNPIQLRIKALNALRAKYPALASGAQIVRGADGPTIVTSRIDAIDRREFLVGMNNSAVATALEVQTSSPNTKFTAIWNSIDVITSDGSGLVKVNVPANGTIVLRAESQLPEATSAITPTLTSSFDKDAKTLNISATVATKDPATVSFAIKVGAAKTWTFIGADDAADYRLFYEYSAIKKGTQVAIVAISKTSSGATAASKVRIVKVP